MVIVFLYSLAGGTMVALATGRPDQIAWKFLRLVSAIVLALSAGVVAWQVSRGTFEHAAVGIPVGWLGTAIALGAAIAVFMAPAATKRPRTFRTVCALSGIAGLTAALLSTWAWHDYEPAHTSANAFLVVDRLLASALLGSITVAWILGHAYLTATSMSIRPLHRISRVLMGCAILRFAFAAFSLGVAWFVGREMEPTLLSSIGYSWLISGLRVGAGLLGVTAIAYMVLDCVRIRSTQSATGLLYFGSILAYIGELASLQLLRECGWPL